jgi:hypothetical protein
MSDKAREYAEILYPWSCLRGTVDSLKCQCLESARRQIAEAFDVGEELARAEIEELERKAFEAARRIEGPVEGKALFGGTLTFASFNDYKAAKK